MFKIFNEPYKVLTEREAIKLYPNKAYIFINPEDLTYTLSGKTIHSGMKGELFAIADNNPEDMEKYYAALNTLGKQGVYTGVFDNFKIEDTVLW